MNNKHTALFAMGIWIGSALLIVGCFPLQRPAAQKQFFMLDVKMPTVRNSSANGILKVQSMRVFPPYGSQSFVYARGQGVFETDFYNGFFASPSVMLTELVRRWMDASGLFHPVVASTSYIEATHVLEGTVTAFYGDYGNGQKLQAVMEMEFLLVNNTGSAPAVILDKSYRSEIPVQGTWPGELVKGWNEAFESIMTAFGKDVGDVLSKTPSAFR